MNNNRKVIERLFFGVDFKILNQCVDEKIKFIKYEIIILLLTALSTWVAIKFFRYDIWGILYGVVVLFSYKMYLSNLYISLVGDSNWFYNWIFSTLLAMSTASMFLDNRHLLRYMDYPSSILIIVAVLIIFYLPVRFRKNKDSQYAKLLLATAEAEQESAKQTVCNELSQEAQTIDVQAELNKKVDELYINTLAKEIAQSRIRVAKAALEKWEEQQKELINQDINKYIIS